MIVHTNINNHNHKRVRISFYSDVDSEAGSKVVFVANKKMVGFDFGSKSKNLQAYHEAINFVIGSFTPPQQLGEGWLIEVREFLEKAYP